LCGIAGRINDRRAFQPIFHFKDSHNNSESRRNTFPISK
jgi:hypothetical protein